MCMDNIKLGQLDYSSDCFLENLALPKHILIFNLAVFFYKLKALISSSRLKNCFGILGVCGVDFHKINIVLGGVGNYKLDVGAFFGEGLTKLVASNTQSTTIMGRQF